MLERLYTSRRARGEAKEEVLRPERRTPAYDIAEVCSEAVAMAWSSER